MRFCHSIFACMLFSWSGAAFANDGFGGLDATGLTFSQTDAVAMEEEDLFIGLDRISVDYVFHNTSASDVTGEVIFPLPPISLGDMMNSDINLPTDRDRDNLMNFTATVDGADVPVQIDRVAVIAPPWEENTPLAAQYDTPGRDVTAELAGFGIPLSVNLERVTEMLLTLDKDQQAGMTAAGLAEFFREDGAEGTPDAVFPAWSVVLRYHWTQTFPAGAVMKISHSYENHPPGGLFGWQYPVTEDYLLDEVKRYCIDDGTSRALVKALSYQENGETIVMGTAYNLNYVLRTANSWAGPIGKFRLTLDKGAPGNVISLCVDGIKKTGPTTFVMEKTNFTPDRDLEILVAKPADFQ